MDLVPRIPRERVIRGLFLVTAFAVFGLTIACSYHLGHAGFVAAGAVVAALLVRPVHHASMSLRVEGALDRLECVAMAAARSLCLAALFAICLGGAPLRLAGAVTLASAVALLVVALRRDRARARFLARVYAKQDPSYRIERDDEVRGFELLPPVLSGTITDAVIAHVNASASSYRTSDGPRPLARVTSSLPKMMARIEKRKRAAMMLGGVFGSCASFALFVPLAWKTPSASASTKSAPLVAPSCADAIPYFEERLQSVPGVGRATLLTHAQDASIAEGQGVVLVVPASGRETNAALDATVLATARAIPCSNRLALDVARPTYRAFTVTAEVALEHGADEASVRRDAEEQVRELFQPDARAVYNEHFDFGATEKTFGYRVRHALRHVDGVKRVRKLIVNGSETDVPLGPRDFPTLEALSISVVP
jgi:hypothetical protein